MTNVNYVKSGLLFFFILTFSSISFSETSPAGGVKSADVTNSQLAKPNTPTATQTSAPQVTTAPAQAVQAAPVSADASAQNVIVASGDIKSNTNAQSFSGDASKNSQAAANEQLAKPPVSYNFQAPQTDEKIKNVLLSRMNTFDLRKIKSIKWPPYDLLKHKDAEYSDLDKIKDPAALKKRLRERCLEYVKVYESYLVEEYSTEAIKDQYEFQCEVYATILEDVQFTSVDPIFDVPNEGLVRRLDQLTYNMHLAEKNRKLARNDSRERVLNSYSNSPFGIIGIPFQFYFSITQILIIVLLGLSGFLLYKVLRG